MPASDLIRKHKARTSAILILWLLLIPFDRLHGELITTLQQLTHSVASRNHLKADVDLEVTVCSASSREIGVLIVRDETGVELLQVGPLETNVQPGDRLRIQYQSCLLRKRDIGVQLSAPPVINNDGLHSITVATQKVSLRAGKIPIRVEWFNYWRTYSLNVAITPADGVLQPIPSSNLWHTEIAGGETNILPGLVAESFEGTWEVMPDFHLLVPVKVGVVTNFNLSFASRSERVGLRFSGLLDIPADGTYQFAVSSDDGALLFLGDDNVPVSRAGKSTVPAPEPGRLLGGNFNHLNERLWTVVEGRVTSISPVGKGFSFDLGIDRHTITVRLIDAAGLKSSDLMNSRIRIVGVGRPVMTLNQVPVLGRLVAANAGDIVFLEPAGQETPALPITSVARVQSLPIDLARKALPVRIRGTVTDSTKTGQEHWMSFQDDTRGIFVSLRAITNATPMFGELWELEGRSAAGDFAPVVVAEKVTPLGEGLLPQPIQPTWPELLNGSLDVQWAELKGVVTDVHSNTISLHLPEGRLDVELEGRFESELKPFLKDVVKIRGVLYAVWDAATREVRVGRVMMRNSTVTVEISAPPDPFDAVLRTPRELLLFDAQASAFRSVKVRGQIVYVDASQIFVEADGTGLRLLPTQAISFQLGDIVDAVGYPDIGRSELLLREVILRKIGEGPLPDPKRLEEADLLLPNLNSRRVRVEGKLLGWHDEQGALVLEMQTGTRLYVARVSRADSDPGALRVGSKLALTGVYVGRGNEIGNGKVDTESFQLLLNSLSDLVILSQPPWWTLPRLLALVGVLLVILIFTIIWNTQLRRLVEQRTSQLQREIRERERAEREHALETERSRIARDLHDDLGSSLTEISVLASTGQLPHSSPSAHRDLFQAIGRRARGLISALDVIVWAVDPEDNSLQSLADYLTGYTNDFFSHTGITCRFDVPVSCPNIRLEGRVRHDVLMAVKETLNNIVRHANATEVEFRLRADETLLEIDITDNGRGIENSAPGSGHGLKNLSTRLASLGGNCTVERHAEGGTLVKIRLPLNSPANSAVPSEEYP